ncbi:hypothetical protein JCM10207_009006 [Rhodosporidiobolus poonsookiae]
MSLPPPIPAARAASAHLASTAAAASAGAGAAPPGAQPAVLIPPQGGAGTGAGWRPSFTQGILLGQASMVLLAVLFLKYVVFEDPHKAAEAAEERRERRRRKKAGEERDGKGRERKGKGKGKASSSPDLSSSPTAAALLSTLSYDLSSHAPESLDWLNVLLAQLLSSYRLLAASHPAGGARELIEEALNRRTGGGEGEGGMVGIDYVEVEEVELGEGFPMMTAARVRPSGGDGEGVRVELDLDYTDRVSLSLSTRVVLNLPRPRFAILPVSLSLTLARFSGTLTVELPPPTPSASAAAAESPHEHAHHAHPTLHLSLHPDFELELQTSSLLGSRAKLQDVPKIEQLLVARIRAAIQDRVVWPGRVEVALPGVARHSAAAAATAANELDTEAELVFPPSSASNPPSTPPSSASPLSPLSPSFPSSSSAAATHRPSGLAPPLFARTSSSSTPETPSVDLSAPSGPSLTLHPHIHRPSPVGLGAAGAAGGMGAGRAPPSPTESLPGYFPAASSAAAAGRRASAQSGLSGLSGLNAGLSSGKRVASAGGAGVRQRATAGAAGVGVR